MSFKKIDSFIVQFIKTKEDRALLGTFVWAYFSRKTRVCGRFGCSCDGAGAPPHPPASQYAARLIRESALLRAARSASDPAPPSPCTCSLPPLYLQWNGHSVTVVGIRDDGGVRGPGPGPPATLLVFCPQKRRVPALQRRLADAVSRGQRATASDDLGRSTFELPATKLLDQDCQILLTTARTITAAESRRRKHCAKRVGFLNAVATK